MTSQHAFLAPSGAPIWGPSGCPYYPTMAHTYPAPEDTPEAREGTAAHEVLSRRLLKQPVKVGDFAANGEMITQEMFDCTDDLVERIEGIRAQYPDLEERVEQRVHMPAIHPTANHGTPDWQAISRMAAKIWVFDFKFGHRYVDVWENWQLVDYGSGVVNHYKAGALGGLTFEFVIAQPRNYHRDGPIRVWPCDAAHFYRLVDQLRVAAEEATGIDPQMRTGQHCRDCEGITRCPAFRQTCETAIDLSMRDTPHPMDAGAKGLFRSMIADAMGRLKGMATGLDADINAALRAGEIVPGWELKQSEGLLKWAVPLEEVHVLGDMYGIDLRKLAAPTPLQATKKGIDEAVISAYAKRQPGAFEVSPVEPFAAAKAFK